MKRLTSTTLILMFLLLALVSTVHAQDAQTIELESPLSLESTAEGEQFVLTYEGTPGEILELHVLATGETSRGLQTTITDSEGNTVVGGSYESVIFTLLPAGGTYTFTMVSGVAGTYEVTARNAQEIALGEVIEGEILEESPVFFVHRSEGDWGLDFLLVPQEGSFLNSVFVKPFNPAGGLVPAALLQISGSNTTQAQVGFIPYSEGSVYLMVVTAYNRTGSEPSQFTLELTSPDVE